MQENKHTSLAKGFRLTYKEGLMLIPDLLANLAHTASPKGPLVSTQSDRAMMHNIFDDIKNDANDNNIVFNLFVKHDGAVLLSGLKKGTAFQFAEATSMSLADEERRLSIHPLRSPKHIESKLLGQFGSDVRRSQVLWRASYMSRVHPLPPSITRGGLPLNRHSLTHSRSAERECVNECLLSGNPPRVMLGGSGWTRLM